MHKQDIRKNEQGQSMVEFALVLPLLCLILLGIVQFGVVFKDYVSLTDGARAGVRKAVVSRHASCPQCLAEQAVRNSAGGLTGDLQVTVTPPPWQRGGDVVLTASYPYEISLLGVVVKSGRLTSTTTERVE